MKRLHHPLVLLLTAIVVMIGAARSFSSPEPLPADAPGDVFSAGRAELILRELLREELPHVSGTAANEVVRDRIVAQLQSFGYEAGVQFRYHCNPSNGMCSSVENVFAVKEGSEGESAILLTAHYDSGWTGPGAADDGAGTAAVLEIARMMAAGEQPVNDVIFLLTDAEEQGLVGAHAFAALNPAFSKVKLVINLEARGVTGASIMFETGDGNRRLIRRLANFLDRPVANSLAYEFYQRTPNDTDFSVYRREGVIGLNFAFIAGVAAYHTPLDDLDHLDPGSLQHHGQNAWAMVSALSSSELKRLQSRENAGFVDLFALTLLHYPVSIEGGLTLVLAMLVLTAIVSLHSRQLRFRFAFWSIAAVLVMAVSLMAGAWLLSWPLGGWLDLHPLEHPQPWLARLVLILWGLFSLWLAVRYCGRRTSHGSLLLVCWLTLGLTGLVLANSLASSAYIALIPLAAFVFGIPIDLLHMRRGDGLLFASLLGFAAAAYVAFYHFFMLGLLFNFDRAHMMALPLLIVAVAVLPLLTRWRTEDSSGWFPARVMLVLILTGALVHSFLPGFSSERPRPMNLVYEEAQDEDGGILFLEDHYGMLDRDYAEAAGFREIGLSSLPGDQRVEFATTVARQDLPRISTLVGPVEDLEDGTHRYRISILPPDGLQQLSVRIPASSALRSALLNGELALDTAGCRFWGFDSN
jgi:hypothetical protein